MDPITAVGAVASIVQLANTALSLSKTFYTLREALASASDDIQALADDLRTFSQSLTLLSRLLEDSRSWYSDDVYLLTAKIIKDCAELYVKIDKVLIKLGGNGKSNWKMRVKFVYKEGQIRKLMKRLRDMKGTLATILMSLQVDLQLSLLNISSSSKIQRAPDRPLQPETVENLRKAQKVVESCGLLPRYSASLEKADAEECLPALSTESEEPKTLQTSKEVAALQPHSTFSPAMHSFVALPTKMSQSAEATVKYKSVTGPVFSRLAQTHETTDQQLDDESETVIGRKTVTSDAKSVKSSSSVESFKSAVSEQSTMHTQRFVLSHEIKEVKELLGAFRSALDILGNLIERRIHDRKAEVFIAAKDLGASLAAGEAQLDLAHRRYCEKHGIQYVQSWTDYHLRELQAATLLLMREIVMPLHVYTAEHENLQMSKFLILHQHSEECRKRAIEQINDVAGIAERPLMNSVPAIDSKQFYQTQTREAPEIFLPFIGYAFERFGTNHPSGTAGPVSTSLEYPNPFLLSRNTDPSPRPLPLAPVTTQRTNEMYSPSSPAYDPWSPESDPPRAQASYIPNADNTSQTTMRPFHLRFDPPSNSRRSPKQPKATSLNIDTYSIVSSSSRVQDTTTLSPNHPLFPVPQVTAATQSLIEAVSQPESSEKTTIETSSRRARSWEPNNIVDFDLERSGGLRRHMDPTDGHSTLKSQEESDITPSRQREILQKREKLEQLKKKRQQWLLTADNSEVSNLMELPASPRESQPNSMLSLKNLEELADEEEPLNLDMGFGLFDDSTSAVELARISAPETQQANVSGWNAPSSWASRDQYHGSQFKRGKAIDSPEIPAEEHRNPTLSQIREQYTQHREASQSFRLSRQTPLTAEALKRQQRRQASSSRSTKSSASREERRQSTSGSGGDWRKSATTRTTRSGSGGDGENVTIKVTGTTRVMVGGAQIDCPDGGKIEIRQQQKAIRNRSERSDSEYGGPQRIDALVIGQGPGNLFGGTMAGQGSGGSGLVTPLQPYQYRPPQRRISQTESFTPHAFQGTPLLKPEGEFVSRTKAPDPNVHRPQSSQTTSSPADQEGHDGSINKKGQVRPASHDRCHSCNTSETPEWRRSPDGTRTLCNECGLHYAASTRENTMNQSQGSTTGLINLVSSKKPKRRSAGANPREVDPLSAAYNPGRISTAIYEGNLRRQPLEDYQEQLLSLEGVNEDVIGQGDAVGKAAVSNEPVAAVEEWQTSSTNKSKESEKQQNLVAKGGVENLPEHDLTQVDEQRSKELRDYQMGLLTNLNCRQRAGHPLPPTNRPRKTGEFDPENNSQDILQDFDFDSFLHQGEVEFDRTASSHTVESEQKAQFGGYLIAPSITQADLEEQPLYLNPKQFQRILRRRVARRKLEEALKAMPKRKPYLHEVRHGSYARRRPRGPGGRFLTVEEISELEKKASHLKNPEDLDAPSRTQLWWMAYSSLHESHLETFASINHGLEGKFGQLHSSFGGVSNLCEKLSALMKESGTATHDDKPELKAIATLRDDIIRIVVTVDQQLGLEIAIVSWSCVGVCLASLEPILSSSPTSSAISVIKDCLAQLQEIVGIIARYAVMENLYQQSGGALSLKSEYKTELLSLCTTIFEYFASSFNGLRILSHGDVDVQVGRYLGNCKEVAEQIRIKDKACQGFKVVIDIREDSDSDSEEADIEDVNDEGWEHIGIEEGVEAD